MLMYATRELGEVRIIVWRSMLASDSGEIDSALFLLSRGVSLGLENRDTVDDTQVGEQVILSITLVTCRLAVRGV